MADGHEVPVTQVPCAHGGQLDFTWCSGNTIEVCNTGRGPESTRCDWMTMAFSERRLAHTITPLFVELQVKKQTGALQHHDVTRYAERIGECLTAQVANDILPDDDSEIQQLHEKSVWELMRICFVDNQQPGNVTRALIRWFGRWTSLYGSSKEEPLQARIALHTQSEAPGQDVSYWQLLNKLVAIGQLDEAVELLGAHSIWTTDIKAINEDERLYAEYTLVDAFLRFLKYVPLLAENAQLTGSAGTPIADVSLYEESRMRWQNEIQTLLSANNLWSKTAEKSSSSAEGLKQLAATLCGNLDAIRDATSTWLEMMISHLQRGVRSFRMQAHLPSLMQASLDAKGQPDNFMLTSLQKVLEAISSQDINGLLQVCSSRMSPWLSAHLAELLLQNPVGQAALCQEVPSMGCTEVEFYQLEYATWLAGNPTTWHLAVEYLAWCPTQGEARTAALLRQVAAESTPRVAEKALRLCRNYDLPEVAAEVCQMHGSRALSEGRLAAALSWFLKCEHRAGANAAAAAMLRKVARAVSDDENDLKDVCSELQDLQCILDLCTSIDSRSRPQDTLAYLYAILQFQEGIKSPAAEAQTQVVAGLDSLLANTTDGLLEDADVRIGFVADMLFQALPLLETKSLVERAQVKTVLLRLEELELVAGQPASAKQLGKLQAVKVVLGRALARAVLSDNGSKMHRTDGNGYTMHMCM